MQNSVAEDGAPVPKGAVERRGSITNKFSRLFQKQRQTSATRKDAAKQSPPLSKKHSTFFTFRRRKSVVTSSPVRPSLDTAATSTPPTPEDSDDEQSPETKASNIPKQEIPKPEMPKSENVLSPRSRHVRSKKAARSIFKKGINSAWRDESTPDPTPATTPAPTRGPIPPSTPAPTPAPDRVPSQPSINLPPLPKPKSNPVKDPNPRPKLPIESRTAEPLLNLSPLVPRRGSQQMEALHKTPSSEKPPRWSVKYRRQNENGEFEEYQEDFSPPLNSAARDEAVQNVIRRARESQAFADSKRSLTPPPRLVRPIPRLDPPMAQTARKHMPKPSPLAPSQLNRPREEGFAQMQQREFQKREFQGREFQQNHIGERVVASGGGIGRAGVGAAPPMRPQHLMQQAIVVGGAARNLPAIYRTIQPTGKLSEELRVDPSDVVFEGRIGSGGAAEVWRATWRGADVAVKILHEDVAQSKGAPSDDFYRELQIMSRLRHPNLVLLMGASVSHSPICIVTEFCAGGALFEVLHERRVRLSLQQRLKLALDIAKGCLFLHTSTPRIIHRDLKSLNILLADPVESDQNPINAKIADFGLSRYTEKHRMEIQRGHWTGTVCWMAPELFANQPFDESIDVFAFAVVLFEIFAQSLPYSGLQDAMSDTALSQKILLGLRPNLTLIDKMIPQKYTMAIEPIKVLISRCWSTSPSQRPSFQRVIEELKEIQKIVT